MFTEGEPQKTPEEQIAELQAKVADLQPKAEASSQNFERAKTAEEKVKGYKAKFGDLEGEPAKPLEEGEKPKPFDSSAMEKKIDEKVDLRLAGYTPEMIGEIESYARGRNISLSEAAKSPFIQKAVDGLRAEIKSKENTPAPSNKGPVIGGKPASEIFKGGTADEKQSAWETMTKGGVKNNE